MLAGTTTAPIRHRPSPARRGVARAASIALVGVTVWTLVGPVSSANAHASVISTSPPASSLLDSAPSEVSVTFTEPVEIEPDSIVVIDADGTVVSEAAAIQGTTLRAPVTIGTDGWHAVSWYAVSIDGHPISGAWTFRVGAGDAEAPAGFEERAAAAARTSDAARWTFFVAQWASTLATVVLTGTMFVSLLMGIDRRVAGLGLWVAGAAVLTSLIAAGANGPYASVGTGWFDGPSTDAYLGRSLLVAAVLAAIAFTRSRGDQSPTETPLLLAAGPVILSGVALGLPVLTGHAGAEGDAAVVAVMSHLVLAACWLGAIPAMLLLVDHDTDRHRLLARFSRAATWLVAGTLVAGSAGAWLLTGGLTNASQTWGWTLFAKLSLVGVALTAGAWNRWNVVPHADTIGRAQATIALRVEAVALVAIVVASVALTHNGPPRDNAESGRAPTVIQAALSDEVQVQVVIDPARVGTNDIHVFVLDATGLAIDVEELTLVLESDELGVGEITQDLSALGAGHYSGRTDDLGIAGTWELQLVVRPDAFSQVELAESFTVAP